VFWEKKSLHTSAFPPKGHKKQKAKPFAKKAKAKPLKWNVFM